jgi:hypothetical protein
MTTIILKPNKKYVVEQVFEKLKFEYFITTSEVNMDGNISTTYMYFNEFQDMFIELKNEIKSHSGYIIDGDKYEYNIDEKGFYFIGILTMTQPSDQLVTIRTSIISKKEGKIISGWFNDFENKIKKNRNNSDDNNDSSESSFDDSSDDSNDSDD